MTTTGWPGQQDQLETAVFIEFFYVEVRLRKTFQWHETIHHKQCSSAVAKQPMAAGDKPSGQRVVGVEALVKGRVANDGIEVLRKAVPAV